MANVFHIIVSLKIGGAELMLKRLLTECLNYNNYHQTVITLKGSEVIDNDLRAKGIEVVNLDIRSLSSFLGGIYRLMMLMRAKKPDAVFTWMYHADLVGGLLAYLSGIKNIIWGIRNTQIPQQGLSVTKFIIKLCSILSFIVPRVIVCAGHSAKNMHTRLGYCSTKMIVIPNGYDLTAFNPSQNLKIKVKKKLGIKKELKVIGIVGRFDELKDFNNFTKAASRVARKFDNVCFFMAGRGIDLQNNELMLLIKAAKIVDRVYLFGELDPHDIYAAMDFYCLSSKAEGFPNVVAEAMAMETPCIVTDVGDARIIVNKLGKVVPPNNSYQLSEAIINMLRQPDSVIIKMGAEARQSIYDNYDIKKIAKQYFKLSCNFENNGSGRNE